MLCSTEALPCPARSQRCSCPLAGSPRRAGPHSRRSCRSRQSPSPRRRRTTRTTTRRRRRAAPAASPPPTQSPAAPTRKAVVINQPRVTCSGRPAGALHATRVPVPARALAPGAPPPRGRVRTMRRRWSYTARCLASLSVSNAILASMKRCCASGALFTSGCSLSACLRYALLISRSLADCGTPNTSYSEPADVGRRGHVLPCGAKSAPRRSVRERACALHAGSRTFGAAC